MKYRPDYPNRFGSPADARAWAQTFFPWYNDEHYHTALGLLTPADVHYRRAATVIAACLCVYARRQAGQRVLQQAYEQHPDRFVKGLPVHPALPSAVWINPPKVTQSAPAHAPKTTGVDTDDLH